MEKTLGGDRLGSGNKQKVELHNYGMNSFNVSRDFKSTMGPGILYPFLKDVGTNHGTYDIDIDTLVRTLPTQGPLFGTFKLQIDIFSVPFRLYQGILHNNPVNLGLNMDRVYLPKVKFGTIDGKNAPYIEGADYDNKQVDPSSLVKYMGISGYGHHINYLQDTPEMIYRKINAVPFLAYYDIFKCYYSNKQEENAYVITPGTVTETGVEIEKVDVHNYTINRLDLLTSLNIEDPYEYTTAGITGITSNEFWTNSIILKIYLNKQWANTLTKQNDLKNAIYIQIVDGEENTDFDLNGILESVNNTTIIFREEEERTVINVSIQMTDLANYLNTELWGYESGPLNIGIKQDEILTQTYTSSIKLQEFPLSNIDDMRNAILSSNQIGSEFVIDEATYGDIFPYAALVKRTDEDINFNAFELNGLVVKTYQSDLFNNWLNSDYVDTINSLTQVDTTGDSFTIDSLNLAEKVYELLNRILVGGGTYQDWQEAVYGEGAIRMCETPMYIGGMSSEVMFEEVIATTDNSSEKQALGSLGGRGVQIGKKGGNNIHVKLDEPGYIIGIVSLTPRICVSQGNDWDMTELDTINDLHKPQLDGIGFQDLMVEQMAWWNTVLRTNDGENYVASRDAAGKQTAWINYQTAMDKCFGDFARDNSRYMVLDRHYEHGDGPWAVQDITTYIDPSKYNYAFAYAKLNAQNFWIQINAKITARRKMGAQQLPNL